MTPQDLTAWLIRVEAKLDAIQAKCAQIDITLASQAADIQHHIRRTDLLEQRVEQVSDAVKPLADWQTRIRGIGWLVGFLAMMVGMVVAVSKLIDS